MNGTIGNGLMIAGGLLLLAGIAAKYGLLGWFGHLPGDIRVKGEHGAFYFPVTTMIVISIVLSLILNLVRKF